MIKRILVFSVLAFAMVLFLGGFSPPDPGSDFGTWVKDFLQNVGAKAWMPVLALVLVGANYLIRSFLAPRIKWFGSTLGGWCLVFATSFLAGMGDKLWSGGSFSMALVGSCVMVALGAAGAWELAKDATD